MSQKSRHEEFEELNFEDQCKLVYETPLSSKADLVIRSQDPVQLVQTFAPEEVYLMAREMDRSNVPELLQYATPAQLEFMADFECWKYDHIDEKGFLEWLSELAEAENDQLSVWLRSADFHLLIAGFKKYISVLKPDHEWTPDDVIGDQPYFTIDGLYYVFIDEDNMHIVQRCLEIFFEEAKPLYYELLESIISEVDELVEEEAYRMRQVRLSEKGFPETESAQRIYRRLTSVEWEMSARRPKRMEYDRSIEAMPTYPTLWREERLFLDDVFASLADVPRDVQKEIYQELIWLCNKIVACKGIENLSESLVKESYNHARHLLNIALEDLSQGNIAEAKKILCECWIEYIFRWGHTQLLSLRDELERLLAGKGKRGCDALCAYLDEPWGAMVKGIMCAHPVYYDEAEKKETPYRDFKTIKECRAMCTIIAGIGAALRFGEQCSAGKVGGGDQIRSLYEEDELPLYRLLLTLFIQWGCHKKLCFKAVSSSELRIFLATAFEERDQDGTLRMFRESLCADFIATFHTQADFSPMLLKQIKPFFDQAFKKGEEELGLLPIDGVHEGALLTSFFYTAKATRKGKSKKAH